jgi:hypothetical protein
VKLVNVTAVVPVLVMLTPSGELLSPSVQVPKFSVSVLNESVMLVDCPVPESGTIKGLPVALLPMERLAVRVPAAEGVKVTVIPQELLAARVAGLEGQLLDAIAKSPALVPVIVNPLKVTAVLPVLVMVVPWGLLVVLIFWPLKVRLVGEAESVLVTTIPVPVKDTDCGLPVALSVNTTLAVRVPLAVGEKVTCTEQELPEARLAGLLGHELEVIV